ncbi:MAG: glycosyltransferase family 2 protein [Candidatus Eremiobacteraeota bacterium]|nr:glycosyltransferase family 2 protein [Candidatus Eremiobacteraeota bacterium]
MGIRPRFGHVEFRGSSRVAAVVLNWNAWSDTIACVESLLRSSVVPDRIIICDNGSSDGSVGRLVQWGRTQAGFVSFGSPAEALESLAEPTIALIELPRNGGYAYGNNAGMFYALERANAEYVWILNNDTVVEREALARMLEVADSDSSIGLVGSQLLRYDAPETIQALGGGYIIPVICHDTQLAGGQPAETSLTKPIPLDHILGASLLVRGEAACHVGFIDESYFLYREETDWCIRMRRAGWKLYCCPQARVWHKQSHSIGFKTPLHDYYAVRNMLHLVWKFYPFAMPAAFGYFAIRSIAPKVVRLETARLLAVMYAIADFLAGVKGRSERHTDAMLVGSYLGSRAKRAHGAPVMWRPAWWTGLKAAGVAVVFLLIAAQIPASRYAPSAPGHRSVATRAHAHAHAAPKPRRVAAAFTVR